MGVLVDERLAVDHAVTDEERVARDVLERGDIHRKCRTKLRQQHDLDLESILDARAPRKAEHPVVVDYRYLEVVPVIDLENRLRVASKRASDQPVTVGCHTADGV